MSAEESTRAGCGPLGCLPLVVSLLVVWALVFGFTWNGVHHEIECSCNRGVEVKP